MRPMAIRQLIERVRQDAGASAASPGSALGRPSATVGREIIALAQVAAAMHLAQMAESHERSAAPLAEATP